MANNDCNRILKEFPCEYNELKNQKLFEDLPMIFNECKGRTLIGSDRSNK